MGIFDTLGYVEYENENDLCEILSSISDFSALRPSSSLDRNAPVYLIETPVRGEAVSRIIARVKKARLQYRSFTPSEETRLSAIDSIDHVNSSFGIIIPLLNSAAVDSDVHNIRGAFISGLSHGMSKPTLIIQSFDGPVPIDIRDFARSYKHPSEIDDHIHIFSLDVVEYLQRADDLEIPASNLLSRITIGDPMAENEFQTLSRYYLRTDEFARAVRGEVNLVVGRKGSGKTALFSQVRNEKRENKFNIIVDLKPEGYQITKLNEQVLEYLSVGAKSHLITAFWEYLLYLEVCYKIIEKDHLRHLRDQNLYDGYRMLDELYHSGKNISEGDFSERLLDLSNNVVQNYLRIEKNRKNTKLTTDIITQIVYSHDIKKIRAHLSDYLVHKNSVWILFDNLDKGWSTRGLAEGDIIILRCLIDAARKIQREMSKNGHDFHAIVFIRNDIYQLLMDETPDFGKETRASLDWSDPDLLRELLRKRLVQNDFPPKTKFSQIWNRIVVSHYRGEETAQYFIDRSLMRPRNLLKIFAYCRGFAVNLEHSKIGPEDIEKGLKSYSTDLVIDADQELTDIEPSADGLIYNFMEESSTFTPEELDIILDLSGISDANKQKVTEFLLYYGFLGIEYAQDDPKYIYDVGYDMKILKTFVRKNYKAIKYALNPAFWPSLNIKPA